MADDSIFLARKQWKIFKFPQKITRMFKKALPVHPHLLGQRKIYKHEQLCTLTITAIK